MTRLPHDARPTPAGAYARLLAAAAATALVTMIGVLLCGSMIAGSIRSALLAAIAIGFSGSLAASAIVAFCIRRPPAELAAAVLGSLGVRFVLTLGAALALRSAAGEALPGDALLIAVGVAQLVYLAVDTAAQVILLRGACGPARAEAR